MKMKDVHIEKSARRTVTIHIREDGHVVVKTPMRFPEHKVNDVLREHHDWIIRKQELMLRKVKEIPEKQFIENEGFLYQGVTYPLHLTLKQDEPLKFHEAFYLVKFNQKKARDFFISWYKKQALEKVSERTAMFAELSGVTYKNIGLSEATTKWGSCSSDGELLYNWKLIMAPPLVLDYVVAHEVSHVTHHNHSTSFWNTVERLFPQYEVYKRWLKQNGHLLRV